MAKVRLTIAACGALSRRPISDHYLPRLGHWLHTPHLIREAHACRPGAAPSPAVPAVPDS